VGRGVEELIMATGAAIDRHNRAPDSLIWTAKAADILGAVKRARKILDNRQFACRTIQQTEVCPRGPKSRSGKLGAAVNRIPVRSQFRIRTPRGVN